MEISSRSIRQFQHTVFSFYQENKRDLPWRHTTDPYFILLSEVMLQQTYVDRVKKYYLQWIMKWPTLDDFARARRTDVLKAWLGLGYNTRAVSLHRTAQIIQEDYYGDVLLAMDHYKELPGIGTYTAFAIKIFSRNDNIVTVDTNIRRILIHVFRLPLDVSDVALAMLAKRCLPKKRSRDWHNALMDYGNLVLTSRLTRIKPKTRQSRFEGSDRQLRARILRFFLHSKHSSASLSSLVRILSLSDKLRLHSILEGMIRDHLLTYDRKRYTLIR